MSLFWDFLLFYQADLLKLGQVVEGVSVKMLLLQVIPAIINGIHVGALNVVVLLCCLFLFFIQVQHSSVAWTECWISNVLDSSPLWIKYSWQRTLPSSQPHPFLFNSFFTIMVFWSLTTLVVSVHPLLCFKCLLCLRPSCSQFGLCNFMKWHVTMETWSVHAKLKKYFFGGYFVILLQNDSVLSVRHLALGVWNDFSVCNLWGHDSLKHYFSVPHHH